MGNSYVYSGIDPKLMDSTGFRTYNFGISTAGVHYYEVLLEDYLKNVKKPPKTILFLINPMSVSSASDNWQAYSIHRYLVSPVSNEYILFKYNTYREYLGMLKKSSTKGFKYFRSMVVKNNSAKKDSIKRNKGFYPSEDIYNKTIYNNDVNFYKPFLQETFAIEKVEELITLAKKYKEKNIHILFYEIPTFKLKAFFSKEYMTDYASSLQLIRKNGFEIIPYKTEMDSTCFRNIDHLNNKGAVIYTRCLIQSLKEYE
jgi:hypothetical protein